MRKRVAATVLWFYATWYGVQVIAYLLGMPEAGDGVGPLAGAAVGLLIASDPRRILWTRPAARTSVDAPIAAPTSA